MKAEFVRVIVALVLTLGVACGEEAQLGEKSAASTVTPIPHVASGDSTPTVTPITLSPTSSPFENPMAMPVPDGLEKLVTSLVRIRFSDRKLGSGFVVKGGYVVTAAHVASSRTSVDVVFGDGSIHTDVPVVSYDYLADLAFLGPINTSAPHVEFAKVEDASKGDAVYILGYPTRELSIAKGEFEYFYNWSDADVEEVHSTAHVLDGMSGGPMANSSGEVIGVLAWGSDDGGSGGTSSNIVQDRLDRIARGEEASLAGSRFLPVDSGRYEHEFALRGPSDIETFVIRDLYNASINLEFDATRDVEYGLFDEHGDADLTPAFRSTRSGLTNACCYDGTWFVVVKQVFDLESEISLRSSVRLAPFHDLDDGRQLRVGETAFGVFDTPGDIDRYAIDLAAGRRVGVRFEAGHSVLMEMVYPDALPCERLSVEGTFEEVEYQATADAEFAITIQSDIQADSWLDGYTLSVYDTGTKPVEVIESPVGDMARHTFAQSSPTVQIDYPLNITGGDDREVLGAAVFEQGCRGEVVALEERELSFLRRTPQEILSLDEFVRRSVLFNDLPLFDKQVTTRREIVTPFEASILIEDFEAHEGGTKGVRLAYIHEGTTGFMAVFYAPSEVFEEWRPVVDYSIGTFSIGKFSVAAGMLEH